MKTKTQRVFNRDFSVHSPLPMLFMATRPNWLQRALIRAKKMLSNRSGK